VRLGGVWESVVLHAIVLGFAVQNSRRMQRSVSSMFDWQKERERKLEERRQSQLQAEQVLIKAAPVLSKRTEALAEQARQKKKTEAQARKVPSLCYSLSIVSLALDCVERVGGGKGDIFRSAQVWMRLWSKGDVGMVTEGWTEDGLWLWQRVAEGIEATY
jgi:hypothetical protein